MFCIIIYTLLETKEPWVQFFPTRGSFKGLRACKEPWQPLVFVLGIHAGDKQRRYGVVKMLLSVN